MIKLKATPPKSTWKIEILISDRDEKEQALSAARVFYQGYAEDFTQVLQGAELFSKDILNDFTITNVKTNTNIGSIRYIFQGILKKDGTPVVFTYNAIEQARHFN